MATKEQYLKEKALAKLVELFEAQERVAAIYAEIAMHYPEAVELIDKQDPSLAMLRQEAERKWNEYQAKHGNAA